MKQHDHAKRLIHSFLLDDSTHSLSLVNTILATFSLFSLRLNYFLVSSSFVITVFVFVAIFVHSSVRDRTILIHDQLLSCILYGSSQDTGTMLHVSMLPCSMHSKQQTRQAATHNPRVQ